MGVVTCWQRRSRAIGSIRSLVISSWRQRENATGIATINVESKVRSREGVYDSLNGFHPGSGREGGKEATESQVGQKVEGLGVEVKDNSAHGPVRMIIWRGFLCIVVVKGDIGAEDVHSVLEGRRVMEHSTGLDKTEK